MGAEGGVCWFKLKQEKFRDRVLELLSPFYQFFINESDFREDSCNEWFDKNDWVFLKKYIFNYYGTHRDFDFLYLKEILLSEPEEICSNINLTFFELFEDLKCKPFFDYYLNKYIYLENTYCPQYRALLSDLEYLLWDLCRYINEEEEIKKDLGILNDMKISDWHEELLTMIDMKSFGYEETWT